MVCERLFYFIFKVLTVFVDYKIINQGLKTIRWHFITLIKQNLSASQY